VWRDERGRPSDVTGGTGDARDVEAFISVETGIAWDTTEVITSGGRLSTRHNIYIIF
jgi:hypothetical protein